MPEQLWRLGLTQAARAIRAGRIACVDYTRSCLDRIAALEPAVQAWAWLDPERALEQARAADRERAAACMDGHAQGAAHLLAESGGEEGGRPVPQAGRPLLGIPLGIKDIFDTRGIPTEMGSPLFRGHVPAQSAQAVLRLKQAGAFVLGKTVTAEMAYLAPGKTRNPWHPAHTPGGSSSGSAAAVAAGFVPAALGTQTNGSVIRPAAYCGVVGYKPSQGMVASTGVLRFSRTLDQVGLFVRSIQDAALLAAALGSRPLDPPAMLERAPRLAAVRSPVWERAEASQREAFANALRILARAGASIDALELGGAALRAHEAHRTIMYAEGAHTLGGLWRERRGSMSRVLSALIEEGLTIGAARYLEALELRAELQSELSLLLRDFDAILTPPATGEAPGTLEHTGDPVFCTLWTLAGLPALTLPIGRGPRGLPLGLQIVGAAGEDAALLGVARWCEQRLPGTGLFPANQEEEG